MTERENSREAARDLAVPSIRAILAKRRNAVHHSKPLVLAHLNTDLVRVIRAALILGLSDGMIAGAAVHPDDYRVLDAVIMRERNARILLDAHGESLTSPEVK